MVIEQNLNVQGALVAFKEGKLRLWCFARIKGKLRPFIMCFIERGNWNRARAQAVGLESW
jgi:hypothetical protein